MRRCLRLTAALTAGCLALLAPGTALADHTDPGAPLSPVLPQSGSPALTAGEGNWTFLGNYGPMQGTDLEVFRKNGIDYVSAGTLGQAPDGTPGFVGQRILQLTDAAGEVAPRVVADHGSARCALNTSATGLQHDVQAVPRVETELLVDTTDAIGRCHDTPGGGLEIIDVTGLGTDGFEPREIALLRFNGLSHTVTADATRPGILYNNQADFAATTWIDVVDARSCLGLAGRTLEQKRALCRPVVTRIDYADEVSSKVLADGTLTEPASCHDITAAPDRLYCAGLNASFVVDVSGLFDASGKVRGTPLPCTLTEGTTTGATVTDCALRPEGVTTANPTAQQSLDAYAALGSPAAQGARIVTTVNHPGRDCSPVPALTCNTNTVVRSDEGVAVSHENDPALGGRFMFVTDERGGGVVPPGATCAPGLDNPIGNGGLHVFDISDPAKPVYARTVDGKKAIFIGTSPTPSPTFCTIHVIEQVPGEARVIAAYYDGGTKIVDYTVDAAGRWTFTETAAYRLPGANTWASEVFKSVDHGDGTKTYYFVSSSFALGEGTARGLDVFSWTGPSNLLSAAVVQPGGAAPAPVGAPPAQEQPAVAAPPPGTGTGTLPATGADLALAALALLVLPLAYLVRRWRGRQDTVT
ncbi:MAG: hypothetical protein WD794_07640 [Mycobacteriales bacterium]